MQNVDTLKAGIISTLDDLPFENLQLLAEFVSFLQAKSSEETGQQKPVIKLGGLWEGTPAITAEEITQLRHELWGNFGEREL